MNWKRSAICLMGAGLLCLACIEAARAQEEVLPEGQALLKAMVDEMNRSMDLQLEDLEKPYFILYMVDDSLAYSMEATAGAVSSFRRDRSRTFYSQVRTGSYELDNTNFSSGGGGGFSFGGRRRGGGGSGRASLPLDDDYLAIRQAIWWATDGDYKNAVETLTQKKAYMKDKKLSERPHDFTKEAPEVCTEPSARLSFDQRAWEDLLKKVSARFKDFPQIQDATVQLTAGAENQYTVNSEGTRVRTAGAIVSLAIRAEVQAEDGMSISDEVTLQLDPSAGVPDAESVLPRVDELVKNLTAVKAAPILESYTGPVLFEGLAAAQMFQRLLAQDIAGQAEVVGTQRTRRGGGGGVGGALEKKLNQSILPDTFDVYDDPTLKECNGIPLLGHYAYDDEGVKARRVDLVEKGELKTLLMSRTPTGKLSGSNGHGRRGPGSGRISAAVGCLFIQDEAGLSPKELKDALIETAADQGLEYGILIRKIKTPGLIFDQNDIMAMMRNMQRGGEGPALEDPILVYKVYVDDGREEMVRGCELGQVKARDLRDIQAAGSESTIYNFVGRGREGAAPSSVAAPSVLFEELDLYGIEAEHSKPPILKSPLFR